MYAWLNNIFVITIVGISSIIFSDHYFMQFFSWSDTYFSYFFIWTNIIDKINNCSQSKIDAENRLSVFNYGDLEKKELDLSKNKNNTSDTESELESFDLETDSITESMSESIKLIESTLNQISAVHYVIALE